MSATSMIDSFRNAAVSRLTADPRLVGLLEAGSGAVDALDRFSDLDLILVARDEAYDAVLADRPGIAAGLGALLSSFTGEHVGEPRLLICLYGVEEGDGVLHVDLKVVRAADLTARVDDPRILADATGACAAALAAAPARWPEREPQWFEDRFWIWIHYAAARLGRGEAFEALDSLGFVRGQVLAPMLARHAGRPQRGLRRIETLPDNADALHATVSAADRVGLFAALQAAMALYVALRADQPPPTPRTGAEARVSTYVEMLARKA